MRSQNFAFAESVLSRAWKSPPPLRRTNAYHQVRVAYFTSPAVEQESLLSPSSPHRRATIRVHNSLSQGCLSYPKSWAWQQFLLGRRLEHRRRRRQQQEHGEVHNDDDDGHDHDRDCVLILEHAPVYTLGRGADETHLTFLNDPSHGDSECRAEGLAKLSRTARGPGTARLAVDRLIGGGQQLLLPLHGDAAAEQQAVVVDALAGSACPVLAPNGVPVFRVERGGEVTFHGPSQLVVYPMFDLQRPPFRPDLHWYLRMIEEVVLQSLMHYDIEGHRDEVNTGVWVVDAEPGGTDDGCGGGTSSSSSRNPSSSSNKVAAVGISTSRWITTHGFALNVDPDLAYFDTSIILPCGIEGRGVTSMAEILRSRNRPVPTLDDVADVVTWKLQEVFGVEKLD